MLKILSKEEMPLYIEVLHNLSAYNLGKYSNLSVEEVKESLEDLKKLELTEKFKEKFLSTSSFRDEEEKNRELERFGKIALMVFDKSSEGSNLK